MSQAHPWFEGVEWEKIYQMEAAFIPEVNDDLDTQNFEKFDEVFLFFILFSSSSCCFNLHPNCSINFLDKNHIYMHV